MVAEGLYLEEILRTPTASEIKYQNTIDFVLEHFLQEI